MRSSRFASILLGAACCSLPLACGRKFNPESGAPPAAQVIEESHTGRVSVDHPEQFPVIAAEKLEAADSLNVTGAINPDISREVPVISLASGRIVDIRTRLDDHVKKGQILLRVQSPDITNAFDTYLKAVNDHQLTRTALARAQDLYQHGAIPLAQVEQADDVEKDAKADLIAAEEQLKTLGVDNQHPSSIVNVYSPITGVVVSQNVTNAAAAGMTYAGSSTVFTIADLSEVWVLCDVYENDLSKVRLAQSASIHVAGYPGKVLGGRVSDIGPILDPTIRTAKVRIQVPNPGGILRLGMFVTADIQSSTKHVHAVVPSAAILHLHDRDWVYVPEGGNKFRRVQVAGGPMLPDGRQEILSGIDPGQKVVGNVLALEATLEAQ